MEVIILAGGEGRRLRPLTRERPKIQLMLGAKTVFEHILTALLPMAPERVHLCLGCHAKAMLRYIHSRHWPVLVTCQVEPEPLGTAGALQLAKLQGYWNTQALVMNGDLLTELDYETILAQSTKDGPVVSLISAADYGGTDFGQVGWDEATGKILEFFEKDRTKAGAWVNAGIYLVSPQDLAGFPLRGTLSLEHDVFPELAKAGHLFGAEIRPEYWLDLGVPWRWLAGQAWIINKGRGLQDIPKIEEGVYIEDGVVLGKGCRLFPPVLLRKGSRVGDASVIGPNVVIDEGCLVGREAHLSELYLGKEARVGQRCRFRRSLVDQHSVIGDEVTLECISIAAGSRISSESNSWQLEGGGCE